MPQGTDNPAGPASMRDVAQLRRQVSPTNLPTDWKQATHGIRRNETVATHHHECNPIGLPPLVGNFGQKIRARSVPEVSKGNGPHTFLEQVTVESECALKLIAYMSRSTPAAFNLQHTVNTIALCILLWLWVLLDEVCLPVSTSDLKVQSHSAQVPTMAFVYGLLLSCTSLVGEVCSKTSCCTFQSLLTSIHFSISL